MFFKNVVNDVNILITNANNYSERCNCLHWARYLPAALRRKNCEYAVRKLS